MSKSIKHLSLSIATGIALGFSWPINGLTFLIFISLIPLLYLEESIRKDNLNLKVLEHLGIVT
jgi:apolipoprotein N-acyltransferase